MTRSRLMQLSGIVGITALLMAGCSSGNGGDSGAEGKVTFSSPETEEMLDDLADAYKQEHSGSEVNGELTGTNDIINQLIAEAGNPSIDAWYGAGSFLPFEEAKTKDLLEPYKPEAVEDWDVVEDDVQMRDKDWNWVAVNYRVLGFAYNTDLVDEEDAPKTWDDLLDPKWKGKIQMANPAASGTSTLAVLSQLERLGDKKGWDYLDKLVDQMSAIPDKGSAPAAAVAKGEAEIGVGFAYHAYIQKGLGESVEFMVPEETPVLANPAAVVKGAKNPEGAQAFVDFLLSDEAQQIFADNYMLTVNENVDSKIPLKLDEVLKSAQKLDIDTVISKYDDTRREWEERY
jgi:iron(III) transport system substrate-binding protein